MINIFTIGYTHKTAKEFFGLLSQNKIETLIDIRLNNKSQLTGFTKKNDLEYFLEKLCGISYLYVPNFAPTRDILDGYKDKTITWDEYEQRFNLLIDKRKIEKELGPHVLHNACLLCSESDAKNCHRRLVAEYLSKHFDDVNITHL
ncbi:MAG: DUF488 domain-containing protein [Treponema sp.]|jgi:uncharacterized protein (DUF488 family)|nr:DUF488 domain-containing protein [Treponema sp.]